MAAPNSHANGAVETDEAFLCLATEAHRESALIIKQLAGMFPWEILPASCPNTNWTEYLLEQFVEYMEKLYHGQVLDDGQLRKFRSALIKSLELKHIHGRKALTANDLRLAYNELKKGPEPESANRRSSQRDRRRSSISRPMSAENTRRTSSTSKVDSARISGTKRSRVEQESPTHVMSTRSSKRFRLETPPNATVPDSPKTPETSRMRKLRGLTEQEDNDAADNVDVDNDDAGNVNVDNDSEASDSEDEDAQEQEDNVNVDNANVGNTNVDNTNVDNDSEDEDEDEEDDSDEDAQDDDETEEEPDAQDVQQGPAGQDVANDESTESHDAEEATLSSVTAATTQSDPDHSSASPARTFQVAEFSITDDDIANGIRRYIGSIVHRQQSTAATMLWKLKADHKGLKQAYAATTGAVNGEHLDLTAAKDRLPAVSVRLKTADSELQKANDALAVIEKLAFKTDDLGPAMQKTVDRAQTIYNRVLTEKETAFQEVAAAEKRVENAKKLSDDAKARLDNNERLTEDLKAKEGADREFKCVVRVETNARDEESGEKFSEFELNFDAIMRRGERSPSSGGRRVMC
ncbi:hypothetical protein FSARC_3291 [Fusarium sarcochroum]|uniref:Uncharacterized protein n=1 Tax=Fusarium sarcochroum TaxID=1208366 RepID=A0A8H4U4Q8_9HYPO|nr:hypothetical protein FSARC_3291 [Fusarium sarcochroum]